MAIARRIGKYLDKNYQNWDISIALRYGPIIDRLKGKVLEVGSGEYGIVPYLKENVDITLLDKDVGNRFYQDKVKYVKASGAKIPFADKSFDTVISVDTLEHISPEHRADFVRECVRVAKKTLILSFPAGKGSEWVDRQLAKYYKWTHKTELKFLQEHVAYGLPDVNKTIQIIKEGKITIEGNTNLVLWVKMLLLGFSEVPVLTLGYRLLVLAYPILRHVNFWPTYRKMIIVEFESV